MRAALPSKQEILDFLKTGDGDAPRREIARAFNVKGDARADLRRLLKEMEEEGLIDRKGRRRFSQAGALSPVAPIDIMSVDDDGDLVCLPAGWRGEEEPPYIRLAARAAKKLKPPPGVGDRVLARLKPAGDDGYEADPIRAIGKGAHRFLAVYRSNKFGGVGEPVERRVRKSFTIERGDDGKAKDGDLVWVETKPTRGYGPNRARVREIAGHVDAPDAFSLIALANHGIPVEFPAAAIEEAARAKVPPPGDRVDLRDTPLVTVDPEDARDHDDAVFAAPDDDKDNAGGFKVIVAIADVSFFVRPGGALDREALRRGNSVYLPDRVVPMLPERLSNDLCSLRENEDRPCLAVELVIDANGRKRRHRFMRAAMRSAAKLSYRETQAIIDGGAAPAPIRKAVHHLHDAYRARLKERSKRAPLDLDMPERRIVLGADGKVKRVEKRERLDAHRLIEEFMILANVAAAETLEKARVPRIYRVHDAPDPEKLDALRDYLNELGYSLVKSGSVKPANFNQILKRAEARDEKDVISEVVLRAQRQAVYSAENLGHFGLNLGRYAHFTSPIRRYADLTVHRALVAACRLGPRGQTEKEAQKLEQTAEQISDFERRAMAAERESSDRYLAAYLAGRVGTEFEGRIRGVTRFGLFVSLDETGADGFIPMRALGFEYFRFEEHLHAVIGETTGGVYRLGQPVTVRLAEATPLTGSLRFDMVSDPLPASAAGAGEPKRSRAKRKTTRKLKKPARRGGPRRRR
ncbi:MAG: ribonuclease R [Parvularculaceae bacterium]